MSRKINIVHINTQDSAGGAAKVAFRLAEEQKLNGHSPSMLVKKKHSVDAPFDIEEICNKEPVNQEFESNGLQYYYYQESHRLIKNARIINSDILHLHNLHGNYFNPFSLALLGAVKPVIWTLHDMQAITGHCAHSLDCNKFTQGCGSCPYMDTYPDLKFDSSEMLLADKKNIYDNSFFKVITPSEWLKAKVDKSVLSSHEVTVIPNGVDTNIFRQYNKSEIRRKYNIPADAIIIGTVAYGGLENSWKGGYYSLEILKSIREKNPNIVFLNIGATTGTVIPGTVNVPFISDEKLLAEVYSCLDIFLFTSIAENCPLVVLEALSCGVPVVSFNTGGVPELVRHNKDGLIVGYKNIHEGTEAVETLLSDPLKLQTFSKNSRLSAVEKFNHRVINEKYELVYRQTAEQWNKLAFEKKLPVLPVEQIPSYIKTPVFMSMYNSIVPAAINSVNANADLLSPGQKISPDQQSQAENYQYDLSIILATKNRGELLNQMLTSLEKAAGNISYEVIIIEGGSDDNTMEILSSHNIEKIYNEELYLGPGKHTWPRLYNFGFSMASGKWGMYASDDILFSENSLARALEILNNQSEDTAGGIFYYRNITGKNGWEKFGIDYTYGQLLLMNYGLVRMKAFFEAEGLDERFKFYCADGDLCLKFYKAGKKLIPLDKCCVTHNNVLDELKKTNNAQAENDIVFYGEKWKNFVSIKLPDPRRLFLNEKDDNINIKPVKIEEQKKPENKMQQSTKNPPNTPDRIIKLHLGCGEKYLPGYVNIDYPSDEHNVMNVRPDVACDLMELSVPDATIDEIRLHHVFEHFNRVTALALLIRWYGWLKPGGLLYIETPDLIGSAKTLLSDESFKVKMGVVRHLAGDQAASWAYHVDQWFPERFEKTLSCLGFGNISVETSSWTKEPYLSNVEVKAIKTTSFTVQELIQRADELLWDSTVSPKEERTYNVWREQLRKVLRGEDIYKNAKVNPEKDSAGSVTVKLPSVDAAPYGPHAFDFNQRERDNWVMKNAQSIPAGATVLDIGAGTCPYKSLFAHCNYITHDFKKYEGLKLGNTQEYGEIDVESDIINIPLKDNYADVILCTEVLEHVPEPIKALQEMARLLKPGGKLFITAPLGSGLHQLPYHYYGGYTPEWYRHFGEKFGLNIKEIVPNGGFFKLISQEASRVKSFFKQHPELAGEYADSFQYLFGEWMPKYLYETDNKCFIDQFTVGYHVVFEKQSVNNKVKQNEDDQLRMRVPGNNTTGIIFSKNRAMQLDAVLKSFYMNCSDAENVNLNVLYSASGKHIKQYNRLKNEYRNVFFIEETNFKKQLLNIVSGSEFILFLVDDNIFINEFSIKSVCRSLQQEEAAIGFSLRLGKNTGYCYPKNCSQTLPHFTNHNEDILIFNWTNAQLDFNYPLEVSSSVYRTRELLPVLQKADYRNPNTLEGIFSEVKNFYSNNKPLLFCFSISVAFCAPVNKVQEEISNRAGVNAGYSTETLSDLFESGKRIDTAALKEFVPGACHQEIELNFTEEPDTINKKPEVIISVYTAAYNAEKYISAAINSVLDQSFTDFEYIIVDDGSTDRTAEIIQKFKDSRIRFFKREHKNFAAAMNYAISQSTGKYIIGVDSDDFIASGFLADLYAAALENPGADYIYPEEFTIIDANSNLTGKNSRFEDFSGDKNKLLLQKLFFEATGRVPNPGSLKKRSLYEKLGLYDELETIEDFVFLSNNAMHIQFKMAEGVKGYFYRESENSNSRKYDIRGRIMADTIFNMATKYKPVTFFPEIENLSVPAMTAEFLNKIYKVFRRHSEFYAGRGGKHFALYAEKIEELITSNEPVRTVE